MGEKQKIIYGDGYGDGWSNIGGVGVYGVLYNACFNLLKIGCKTHAVDFLEKKASNNEVVVFDSCKEHGVGLIVNGLYNQCIITRARCERVDNGALWCNRYSLMRHDEVRAIIDESKKDDLMLDGSAQIRGVGVK